MVTPPVSSEAQPISGGSGVGHSQVVVQQPGASAALQVTATIGKAVVKYKTLLELAENTRQDMEDQGLFLETATDEKISKLVQKISKFEKIKDKIKTAHNDYLEFTALHKPDPTTYDPKKLDEAVITALSAIETLVSGLEQEDEERELGTMLPRKSEKVKWPNFSGKSGENFAKFKEFMRSSLQEYYK